MRGELPFVGCWDAYIHMHPNGIMADAPPKLIDSSMLATPILPIRTMMVSS
jgi:hypothetical protein